MPPSALFIPELTEEIAGYLTLRDRSTLARTNLYFHLCLSPSVWSTLVDAGPLLVLFTNMFYFQNAWIFTSAIRPQELQRFLFYASHVRQIHSLYHRGRTTYSRVHPQVFRSIQQAQVNPDHHIFPKLGSAAILDIQSLHFDPMLLRIPFLGHKLVELNLTISDSMVLLAREVLAECSSTLVCLRLSGAHCLSHKVTETLHCMEQLDTFAIDLKGLEHGPYHARAFWTLEPMIANIRDLTILYPPACSLFGTFVRQSFGKLEQLTLRGTTEAINLNLHHVLVAKAATASMTTLTCRLAYTFVHNYSTTLERIQYAVQGLQKLEGVKVEVGLYDSVQLKHITIVDKRWGVALKDFGHAGPLQFVLEKKKFLVS